MFEVTLSSAEVTGTFAVEVMETLLGLDHGWSTSVTGTFAVEVMETKDLPHAIKLSSLRAPLL